MNFETSTHTEKSKILPFPIVRQGATQFDRPKESAPGPIEQKMRKTLDSLKGCKYPDEHFDWSIYDKIAAKFDEPPRGGVVFNTTFKLVNWHSSCSKCLYAFEIDTYGRGCFHDCVYCYAKEQLTAHGYWNQPQPFPVNLAEIRKHFYTVFETNKSSKWRQVLEKKIPIRIGSMSDSFMYMDSRYGVTKELLRILKYYKYPYIVFTRSDLVAHDDYLDLLDQNLCAIQFSISGNNQACIKQIEPQAPSYKRRLRALRKLSDHGFWTTVRINPLFPKYPDGYFTDPESIKERFGNKNAVPTLPIYNDDFISELSDAGAPSILAGVVRLNGFSIKRLSNATGIDINQFFLPQNRPLRSRDDAVYSDAEIGHYYKWLNQECRKNGIRFSTCYIGNGIKDFFQYQHLWSNENRDCCDASGKVPAFKTSANDLSWDFRAKHAPCKQAAWDVRKAELEFEKNN